MTVTRRCFLTSAAIPFIGTAARVLNERGTRQIDDDEVTELLEWAAHARATGGRVAA